jgi:hypothetical protein
MSSLDKQKKKEKICEDCMAHYPEGYNHVCPPWLKILVTNYKKKQAKEI